MTKTVVFGYGNVGRAAVTACLESADMQLVGIVDPVCAGQAAVGLAISAQMEGLPQFDAAILALPSRLVPDVAESLLRKGICTADGFDMHGSIPDVRARLDAAGKSGGAAAILAAGWDPGTDSIVRALMEAMTPTGITYTNFGPGMSMGHSVAARSVTGVRDALSMTIPTGTGVHRRMVYVELEPGHTLDDVARAIKADDYFAHDETHVMAVDSVPALRDVGHGVRIERKGAAAAVHNQLLGFDMKLNGPAVTGQVLVCAARAAVLQRPGCYTMIEVPPVDFLSMSRDEAVRRLV